MEKKNRSGKDALRRSLIILVAGMFICFLGISVYSMWTYQKQLVYCNQAAINLYDNNLRHTFEEALSFDESIYAGNQDFRLLSIDAGRLSDREQLASMKNLRQMVSNRSGAALCTYVFNESGSLDYYHFGKGVTENYVTKELMSRTGQIKEFWLSADRSMLPSWQLIRAGDRYFLSNAYCYKNIYICTSIDLQVYADASADGDEAVRYVLYSDEDMVANRSFADAAGLTLADLREGEKMVTRLSLEGEIVLARFYPAYGIGFAGIIATTGIWSYLRSFILLMLIAMAVLILAFILTYRFAGRVLLYPLEQISRMSRHLSEPDYRLPARKGEVDILEFEEIRTALVGLMEQKNRLEQENLAKTQETDHAYLQYYQLQTRSHFFLNCLKSIYSMTENGETEKTKRMITLFSNHLRYVYHDNLTLVRLGDELEEVQDYYQIIQLDHARPILLSVDVDEALTDIQVPPLCIQTFLENSHKHNAQTNKILKFTVRADIAEMEGKNYLRLRLSDNGSGYTQEILEKLSEKNSDHEFEQYHVGINNLKRRIRLLYGEEAQLAFYNLPGGGACNVICLPLREGYMK